MPIKIKVLNAEALEKMGRLAHEARERLMGDLFDSANAFGFDTVARAKRDYLRGPKGTHIMSKGLLKTRIDTETTRSGNIITTKVGSNLIYAAIQEFGGITHPSLTSKMRKFAWAMFYRSNDEMWKLLALSKKSRLTIKIPERPYLRPAMKDAMPTFQENIARSLRKLEFVG